MLWNMKQLDVIKRLAEYDQRDGRYVFTGKDLATICREDSVRSFQATLMRLVGAGVLQRATRDVFVYGLSGNLRKGYTVERIATALRRGEYNYVSLESALAEYGVMLQVPLRRITVMTTGRKGEFKTPYGEIEFTHTERSYMDILNCSKDIDRPLKLATCRAAIRDLRRVGRNTHLIDEEELEEIEQG